MGRRSAEPDVCGFLARDSPRPERLGGTSPYRLPLSSQLDSKPAIDAGPILGSLPQLMDFAFAGYFISFGYWFTRAGWRVVD